jgi:alpha-1,2-mannosyltransferase
MTRSTIRGVRREWDSRPEAARTDARGRSRRAWGPSTVAGLAAVIAVLLACFGWRVGAFDFHSIQSAATALIHGGNPYSSITSPTFRAGHAFVYPYVAAWAFVPLAVLPGPLAAAAYLAVSVLAIIAACHLLRRPGFLPAALLLSSSTTVIGLQVGTVNALLLLGVALAWSQRDRWVVAGLVVAATAVIKLFLLPLLAWLILARRWRAAGVAGATLTAALGIGWLVGPLDAHGYAAMLNALQGNESSVSWSLASFLHSLGATRGVADASAVGSAVVVIVLGAVRAWRTDDERNLFAATIIASLLATPIMWSSYLLVLAAVVLVVATDDRTVALLALSSWAVVTPDVTTGSRTATGVALTVGLAAAAFWRSRPSAGSSARPVGAGDSKVQEAYALTGQLRHIRWPRSVPSPTQVLAAAGLLLVLAVIVLVPSSVRNALPALLVVGAAGLEVARRARPGAQPGDAGARCSPA